MIIKGLLELIFGLLQIVFLPINLPDLPSGIQSVLDGVQELMIGSFGLLSVFVDVDVLKFLIPVVLVIVNFERIYDLVIYILKKIPFIGIQ